MIRRYHDGTKHHVDRFARSLGYLDWATQPNPFRSFAGAATTPLPPRPDSRAIGALAASVGSILRNALGLTAWKQFQDSRWSLRANPSSGNLHPTESYVVAGDAVYHYAPDRHELERRARLDVELAPDVLLIALTSIHWREAWKYGERAFRYCQHDLGHAIASLAIAASLEEWDAVLLPEWSHDDIAELTGLDRADDYVDAEPEEPGCLLALRRRTAAPLPDRAALLEAARHATWSGRASQLSGERVQWTFIDEIAAATRDPGRSVAPLRPASAAAGYPERIVRQRRSAVALDGRSAIDLDRFLTMLERVMPAERSPWSTMWWSARVHLALFVHRVEGLPAGLYLLLREPASGARLEAALGREFVREPVSDRLPLWRLAAGDARRLAQRVSCDQEIAADGFFSLGMIAEFDASLAEFGPSFYRHLFWETGIVGQVLYLEAEAAGARGTGIGCFYDDPMHDVLGLTGHAFQSLYHFTIGIPVEDARLTTTPGYGWEV